jgi:hypothetical protein
MSDDQTRPIEPDAPTPPDPAEAPPQQPVAAQPAYAMPQPMPQSMPQSMPLPAGYPAYAAQQRPRFVDQVLGMRAVVAVALACLIIGGLSGWILGHAAGSDNGRGPGFIQRGPFPDGSNGFQNGPNGFPNGPGGFSNQQPGQ